MDYLQYQKYFKKSIDILGQVVLNLIINGLPSIPEFMSFLFGNKEVLNLIINGLPSILKL